MILFGNKSFGKYEKLAYDFSFNDLDGSVIKLSEFKNKVDYLVEGNLGNQDNPSIIINMITNESIR